MALYQIEKNAQGVPTGEYTNVAGGTLWADMPVASEVKFSGQNIPTGFHASDGSTFDTTKYPELYAQLGSNTLPNNSGFIIKMTQIAVPADFMSAVDEAVDEVLTPVTGTVTPTAQLVSGTVRYIKSGNVCTIVFTELTVSTSESNRLLCSGLPLPLAAVFFVCDSGGNYYTMNITGAGELRDANNIALGDKSGLYGSATYVCK